MTESQKMLEIIHKNNRVQRIRNAARKKEQKRAVFLTNILMFLGSSIFMIGLMILISAIENVRF